MPGFFEIIAQNPSGQSLTEAWGLTGAAAGTRALFVRTEAGKALLYRDSGFPVEISGRLPEKAEIRACGDTRVFLAPLPGKRRLVVCGAGHVAQRVVALGAMLGFQVAAIEDREEFAVKARAAGAENVLCRPFGEALDALSGDECTAFVVMTQEHAHDVDCLRRILQKPFAYAGMMGSRSRSERIRRLLQAEGFDSRRVAAVHMPIGLPIGARTPEEIALSAMAEIVSVMNAADAGEGYPPGMPEALADMERTGARGAVLAMIVEKTGEAPRRPGTRMLIHPDGRMIGTVGGGYAEAEILRVAGEMMKAGARTCRLHRIEMIKGEQPCGGEIAVLLRPV